MYKSREHFDYENCHISIDSKTGEILELYTNRNYDNIIKAHLRNTHQPFVIKVEDGKETLSYFPLHTHKCADDKSTYVNISSVEKDGGLLVTVKYSTLTDGENLFKTDLYYTAFLSGSKITFNINVPNQFERGRITEVQFPVISGVFLGERYDDDILVYPSWAGVKIKSPIDFFTKGMDVIEWRWQDYLYGCYQLDSTYNSGRLASQGLKGYSTVYPSGGACMGFFDLYDGDGGIYFGCHDKKCKPVTLDIGNTLPEYTNEGVTRKIGLVMSTAFNPYTECGQIYSSPDVVLAFHEGDWREGAKIYRDFKTPYIDKVDKLYPEWAKNSVGLFAHYDFKYQHGGVVHKYVDIPLLAKKALDAGSDHILLSGWHMGGFDNGYPTYYTDPELGSEEEFIEGVKKAKEMGVHVTLYMNRCLHNAAVNPDKVKDMSIMNADGTYKHSYWGNTTNTEFYDTCPACKEWQDELCGWVKNATDKYGVDGIYLDVLSAGILPCFNPKHNHPFDAFNDGLIQITSRINKEYLSNHDDSIMLMGELVNDTVGGTVAYQLTQSFQYATNGFFPNLYRYTFPTHGIVDMAYPTKNMAFRAVTVSHKAEEIMATMLTNGSYFWAYDLDGDATFDKDEEGMEILKSILRLKKIMANDMDGYNFVDEDDIIVNGSSVVVKNFINSDNNSYLVGYRFTKEDCSVKFENKCKKAIFTFDDGSKKIIKIKKGILKLPQNKMFIAKII